MTPAPIRKHYNGPYTTLDRRCDLEQGQFGAIAPWECDNCGLVWDSPEYHMTHRQTMWEPEEGEEYCADCGRSECFDTHDPKPFKAVRRYTIHHLIAA